MKPETHVGFGSLQCLAEKLSRYHARKVFLVTGERSFVSSGADAALKPLLSRRGVHRFSEFSKNPNMEDLESGIARFRAANADVVVAVGGGSAIDMAKLINVHADEGLHGNVRPGAPLIAVPTTAGTGSETTAFATLYIEGRKHSIAHEFLMPAVAIVDPALTRTLPPLVTASSGMDALAQSIESFWSVSSTDESRRYSKEAIGSIVRHLREAVSKPTDDSRLAMAIAAHVSGKAIQIARTTAPHALSYALTSRFGVPHGQAVAFTLPAFLAFNHAVTERDVADPRGAAYVRNTVEEICGCLGCGTVSEAREKLLELMKAIGLATTFSGWGLDREKAIEVVVREVNTERLANNPRRVGRDQLLELLGSI